MLELCFDVACSGCARGKNARIMVKKLVSGYPFTQPKRTCCGATKAGKRHRRLDQPGQLTGSNVYFSTLPRKPGSGLERFNG